MGSALYQIHNGKPKLIAYASKRLPEVARNYSITELEMYELAINMLPDFKENDFLPLFYNYTIHFYLQAHMDGWVF